MRVNLDGIDKKKKLCHVNSLNLNGHTCTIGFPSQADHSVCLCFNKFTPGACHIDNRRTGR